MARQRPKVLHLITHLNIGGAQDNTLLTAEKHDRARFRVHLASNPNGDWAQRARSAADCFHPLPVLVHPIAPLADLRALLAIARLLRRERFDVVHTHSSKAGLLGRYAARLAGVPAIVHTLHGFSFHDRMPRWKQALFGNLERSARPCTHCLIAVSERNRQQAIRLGLAPAQRTQTVYSGIDFARLDAPTAPQQTQQALGLGPQEQAILMVGRLDPQKAPQYLLQAFAQTLTHCPQTQLWLVGEGELKPQLQAQARELGIAERVRFLGWRHDIPGLLQAAHLFALSSLWEGLGRAMTEAMLLGKPVVVPEIYGIPEIVHPNQTGRLFPAGNVEQLAAHLTELLQAPAERERLGQNARQLTRRLFDAHTMVRQIEGIYEQLLAQSEKAGD